MSKGTIMYNGVDYSNGGLGGNPANNYSTEEQIIGTWIDGKPLYQKTFQINLTKNNTMNKMIVLYGLDLDNVNEIANYSGYVKSSGNVYWALSNYRPGTNGGEIYSIDISVDAVNKSLRVETATDRSMWSVTITIQYTKTTD